MQVNLKFKDQPEDICVNFDTTRLVSDLVVEVAKLFNREPQQIYLIYKGLVLNSEKTLAFYDYVSAPENIIFISFKTAPPLPEQQEQHTLNEAVEFRSIQHTQDEEEKEEEEGATVIDNNNNNNNNNNDEEKKELVFKHTSCEIEFDNNGRMIRLTTTPAAPQTPEACSDYVKDGCVTLKYPDDKPLVFGVVYHGSEVSIDLTNCSALVQRVSDKQALLNTQPHVTVLLSYLRRLFTKNINMVNRISTFAKRVRDIGGSVPLVYLLCRHLRGNFPLNVAAVNLFIQEFTRLLGDRIVLAALTSDLGNEVDKDAEKPLFIDPETVDPNVFVIREEGKCKYVLPERGALEFLSKKNSVWFVYPPNALISNARAPALTVDTEGRLAIYTGRPKMEGANHRVYIQNCEGTVDVEMDTDEATKMLTEKSIEIPSLAEIPVTEITVVCIDTSLSMNDPLDKKAQEDISIMENSFTPLKTPIDDEDVNNLLDKWQWLFGTRARSSTKEFLALQALLDVFLHHNVNITKDAALRYVQRHQDMFRKPSLTPFSSSLFSSDPSKQVNFICLHKGVLYQSWCSSLEDEKKAFKDRMLSPGLHADWEFYRVEPESGRETNDFYQHLVLAHIGQDITVELTLDHSRKKFKGWQPISDVFCWVKMANAGSLYSSRPYAVLYGVKKVDGRKYATYLSFSMKSVKPELEATEGSVIALETYAFDPIPDASFKEMIKLQRKKLITKMDLAKVMFNSFVDRLSAYDLPHALGLVKFESTVNVSMNINQSIEMFRNTVNDLTPYGDTALHDAVCKAVDMIKSYKGMQKDTVVKRVIVLTDGIDTSSRRTYREMNNELVKNKIWLDVVSLGITNEGRNKISNYTGAAFFVNNERDVVDLSESETFLSLALRKRDERFYGKDLKYNGEGDDYYDDDDADDDDNDNNNNNNNNNNNKNKNYGLGKKTDEDKFIQDIKAVDKLCPEISTAQLNPEKRPAFSDANVVRRLMKELDNCKKNPNLGYVIGIKYDDQLSDWDVTFLGPEGTPYYGYEFKMLMTFDGEFPFKAPSCRFYQPSVLHANISMHGRVCHSVLDRNWTPDTSVATVLNCIYGLFLTPEPLDPLNSSLASVMLSDHEAYLSIVKKWVSQKCVRNRRIAASAIATAPRVKLCWSCDKPGPSKRCASCKEAYYCNSVCQRNDWEKSHKRVCIRK